MAGTNQTTMNSDSSNESGNPKLHWFRRFLRIQKLADWIAMIFGVCAALVGLAEQFATKPDYHDLANVIVVGTALIGMLLFAFMQSELLRDFVKRDETRNKELLDAQTELAEVKFELAHARTAESKIARGISDAALATARFHLDAMTLISTGYEHEPARIRHGTN